MDQTLRGMTTSDPRSAQGWIAAIREILVVERPAVITVALPHLFITPELHPVPKTPYLGVHETGCSSNPIAPAPQTATFMIV